MGFYEEIKASYTDVTGLVSSKKCLNTDTNPTGNGVMYTGEFNLLLKLRGEMTPDRSLEYCNTISKCCEYGPGLLIRGPGWNESDPDDFYGFCAGAVASQNDMLAETVLKYGWRHYGSYNGPQPEKWTSDTCLFRQLGLLFSLYKAANRRCFLLSFIVALIIGFSCFSEKGKNLDAWRVTWLLIHATKSSWICRMASKFWYRRLYKIFGTNGMKTVYYLYYQFEHPFITYFPVDKQ